jgi:SAM-dependent methyltransferase
MKPDDPYSRVDYRRLVAWPRRIEREWPFLSRVLGDGGRVLDLGSGTGEHSRFLAARGFEVTGIDSSPSMIAKATDSPVPPNLRFLEGDLADVGRLVDGAFDGAICLGNVLPHVDSRERLLRFLAGLRDRLRPGAPLLLQLLNYDRVFDGGLRALPVSFRQDADGAEAVFLRLMTPMPGGRVVFTPSTLRYRPDADPPLEVVTSKNVNLKGWRRGELEEALDASGFGDRQIFGTVADVPFVPMESPDTVIVAR